MVSKTTTGAIRTIDLFCGIGGNSLGARSAGFQILAGFDKWELATNVYHDNFPEAKVYTKELENLDLEQVKQDVGAVDLIVASPECTNHSVARGNRSRVTYSLELAFEVTRFAQEFQPRWILIENVPNMKNWEKYPEFIQKLIDLGYHIRIQELTASDFGVPQSRKRLFIMCDNQAEPPEVVPPSDVELKFARDILNLNGTYRFTPVEKPGRAKKTVERANYGIQRVGADQPFLMVYYGSGGSLSKGCYQELSEPIRTITTLDRFALVKPESDGHVMRMLQVPELLAAMGFPSDFQLKYGTRREKIHLLGNAVCPPLIKTILKQLTETDQPVRSPGLFGRLI